MSSPMTDSRQNSGGRAALTVVHSVPGAWLPVTQNWLYNQVECLPADVRSHVVCTQRANADVFPQPTVHAMDQQPAAARCVDALLRKARVRTSPALLERVIEETGAAVLHSHFGNVGWQNLDVCRRSGIAHVVTFYGLDVNYLPRHGWMQRYRRLFDEVDRVLCEGPHMARCIVGLGCAAEKVQVQHLGVRVDRVEYHEHARDGERPMRILLAAEFREKKGLPFALEAIGRFRRRTGTAVDVTLMGAAGTSRSSRVEQRNIFDAIDRHDLRPVVRLAGFQPHASLMAAARTHDVFIHPSVTASDGQTEGGAPVVLLDMAASGIPIISTRHCDIPGIVIPGETGLLADERDADGLAEALACHIDDPQRVQRMARQARRHVETNFNALTQGAQLAEQYRSVLGGAAHGVDSAVAERPLRRAA